MSVDVVSFDPETDAAEWNRYVERSPTTTPLFRMEALTRQATETGTTFSPLVGFKGQEAVGLFPVFVVQKGPFTAAFSPPPYAWSGYLGPALLNIEKLKRRTADRRIRRFVEGCTAWVDDEYSPIYQQFVTGPLEDVRPFAWEGFDVTPEYTYVVDLGESAEDVLARFSSDARQNVRSDTDRRCVIEEGSGDDVEAIVSQVRRRYTEQGRSFHLTPAYARGLYEVLPSGAIRPYVCRVDGSFVGGILALESSTTRYRWLGGVRTDTDVDLAVNDLLDWNVMRDGLEQGLDAYDLLGAGVPRINEYKAKFDPRLEHHYTITDGVFGIDRLIDGYRKYC